MESGRSSVSSLGSLVDRDMDLVRGLGSLSDFIEYIFRECSNCVMVESCIEEIRESRVYDGWRAESELDNCKRIRIPVTDTDTPNKTTNVRKILGLFVDRGLLTQRGRVYYLLSSNRRLTWNNIKQLKAKHIKLLGETLDEIRGIFNGRNSDGKLKEYDIVVLVKVLFWYLRKATVDSVLGDIIYRMEKKHGVMTVATSVGSTKLSSDYDVSLDGLYVSSASVIKRFNKIMMILFWDDSESIFDTNVYGVSFSKGTRDDTFTEEHTCDTSSITYISPYVLDIQVSQVIWAYVKLLLRMGAWLERDDKLYERLYTDLEISLGDNPFFEAAVEFVNKYRSDVDDYSNIVGDFREYLDRNVGRGGTSYLVGNFISFVNYNGSETYLTNGAFLDVVINQQMCGNRNPIRISDPYLYFTSFVENVSDLLTHYHKRKYTDRAIRSLDNLDGLIRQFSIIGSTKSKQMLLGIKSDQEACEVDIYGDCYIFDIVRACVGVIGEVSDKFTEWMFMTYDSDQIRGSIERFNSLEFWQRDNSVLIKETLESSPFKLRDI